MKCDFSTKSDATDKLMQDLKNLAKKEVYVGIPDFNAGRKDGKITNAQLWSTKC